MSKFLISFILLSFVFCKTNGQYNDINKQGFKYSFVQLPENPIAKNNRTYQIQRLIYSELQAGFKDMTFFNDLKIDGFEEKVGDAFLTIEISFEKPTVIKKFVDFLFAKEGSGDISKYAPTWIYQQKVVCTVKNNQNLVLAKYPIDKKRKFASEAIGNQQVAQSIMDRPMELNIYYANDAIAYFQNEINNLINKDFGYPTISGSDSLIYWNSVDNVELSEMKKNNQKVISVFNQMQSTSDMKKLYAELKDVIEYYKEFDVKYDADINSFKILKYAAYYNLIKTYYYLDMPKEGFHYLNKLNKVSNDRKEIDFLLKESYDLSVLQKKNSNESRHFEVISKKLPKPAKKPYNIEEDKGFATAKIYYSNRKADENYIKKVHPNQLRSSLTIKIKGKDNKYDDKIIYAKDIDSIRFVNGDLLIGLKFTAIFNNPKDKVNPITEANDTYFTKERYKGNTISIYQFMSSDAIVYNVQTKQIEPIKNGLWASDPLNKMNELAQNCKELKDKITNSEFKVDLDGLIEFSKSLDNCR